MMNKLILAFLLICCMASCEKEVHIKLASAPSQVVVQGAIETGQFPYVFLTSSIGFFSKIDLTTLENSFLHGATITVSDGTITNNLIEYSFDTGSNNKFYIYAPDTNTVNLIRGEVNKLYTLTITYRGKTYTSVTKIPSVNPVDSFWFAEPIFKNSHTPDSARQLFVNYSDPDTPGNCVHYFTRRNRETYFPVDIFSDEIVNGKVVNNIALYAGTQDSINSKNDSLSYFYPGDTVSLKWCGIDKSVYKFWNTLAFASNATGNPFASPINVQSNITNGALGVWEGDGAIITTYIVPHK